MTKRFSMAVKHVTDLQCICLWSLIWNKSSIFFSLSSANSVNVSWIKYNMKDKRCLWSTAGSHHDMSLFVEVTRWPAGYRVTACRDTVLHTHQHTPSLGTDTTTAPHSHTKAVPGTRLCWPITDCQSSCGHKRLNCPHSVCRICNRKDSCPVY